MCQHPLAKLSIAALAIALVMPSLGSDRGVLAEANESTEAKTDGLVILLVNRSGVGLTSLQVAPAKSRAWESNTLRTAMAHGEERQVEIANQRQDCYRDLKAVFANGSSLEDYNVNFCKNDIYTLTTFSVPALW